MGPLKATVRTSALIWSEVGRFSGASQVVLMVKTPLLMQEMQEPQVRSLSQEYPWKRKWQPTLVFLSGKSHAQRSLEGSNPRNCKRVGHNLETKQ